MAVRTKGESKMRIVIIKFSVRDGIEVFEDDDHKGEGLSVCFINSPSINLSEKIRNRIRNLKYTCDRLPEGKEVPLSVCESIARDELEESYVNGLSGKRKP